MVNLYIVYRKYFGSDNSVIGVFLTERLAKNYASQCRLLSKANAVVRVESTVLSTYGMIEETRRELIEAVNPIVMRES